MGRAWNRVTRRQSLRRIAGNCLSELWPVLYLTAERAPEILGAQAEWGTWLLRGRPAGQMPAEGDGGQRCHRASWRIDRARGGTLFTTV